MRKVRLVWQEHRGLMLTAACFVLILLLLLGALQTVQQKNSENQLLQLRQSVLRSAAACYAAEGFYPGELDYLTEHYGLRWDTSRYIVHYDCFAQNILPDIRVLVRGDAS